MDLKDTQQINTASNGQRSIEQAQNSFNQKHGLMSFIVKKTEKITTAIYMVTDFLADSEPLKTELRTLALSLVSDTRKLIARPTEPQVVSSSDISQTIDSTIVFLDLAITIGIISEMNGLILRTELAKVKNSLSEIFDEKKMFITTHPGYANVVLDTKMFEVEKATISNLATFTDNINPTILNKGQEINKGQVQPLDVLYKQEVKPNQVLLSVSKKTDLGNKIARRNDVLTVVRNKGKVSIKDISEILKDIGDKTLQRELHGLVQEGVLVKEGEKRWSMYRIAR